MWKIGKWFLLYLLQQPSRTILKHNHGIKLFHGCQRFGLSFFSRFELDSDKGRNFLTCVLLRINGNSYIMVYKPRVIKFAPKLGPG